MIFFMSCFWSLAPKAWACHWLKPMRARPWVSFVMILRMSFRCESDAAPRLIFAASSARRCASLSTSAVFVS